MLSSIILWGAPWEQVLIRANNDRNNIVRYPTAEYNVQAVCQPNYLTESSSSVNVVLRVVYTYHVPNDVPVTTANLC